MLNRFAPVVVTLLLGVSAARAAEVVEFNRDIRPILSDKCFACHGFDPKTRKAKLRLDTFEGATADKDGTRAIVPGNPAKSEAWKRIITDDESEIMPPKKSNKTITPKERELIKRWIEQGAKYELHWSFEPIRKIETPAGANLIDVLWSRRLEQVGLRPSKEADRPTLIRRVSFATTGLPPTIAETETFLNDAAPGAYERMVERYLASPRFGEEMARHWLDVARYADTHGLHLDNERQMWAYRDWVINAFNQNKPFDQFTIEQLAGDLLPNPTREQLVATGFNRCNVTTSEGGSIAEEFIYRYAVDRTATTMTTWLGLTGSCASCHDHKFDPLTTKEFYSMYAFFHSNADPAMDGNALLTRPTLKLPTPEQDKKLSELNAQLAGKQKELNEKTAKIVYVDPATVEPRPPAEERETLWLDDDFPAGAKVQANPGQPTRWVTEKDGQVLSGKRALRRQDKGLAQDFYNEGSPPLAIPPEGEIFLNVFLDPADPPKAIMVQFHKGDWKHRAVWGDYNAIHFGKVNTTERVHMGPLPDASKWVRLEVPVKKIGLSPGDQIAGFALTQFGGTVYWDKVGVSGRSDPAADPARSMLAWWKLKAGKDSPGVPPEITKMLKDGPEKVKKEEDRAKLRNYYLQNVCVDTRPALEEISKAAAALRKQRDEVDSAVPSTFIYNDMAKPRESFVMLRGAYDKPGDKVEPGTPAVLPPLKKADPNGRANRLDLARWLVAPENPLTARVTVNRYWQQFFGVGLVKSSGDFGSQGQMPSHPELLDALSTHFRESGWDVKGLVRLMLTSQAFRQASNVSTQLLDLDPENRLYARGPRFRLDAEQIRDNVLFVGGLMSHDMGGKGVKTYQPPNVWEPVGFVGSNTRFYKQDSGAALYRRSIYTFIKRTAPAPFLSNFDAPNREQSCTGRERSNTPLQALQLMNDVQHFEAARALAQRMMLEGGADAPARIAHGWRLVLARSPAADELAVVHDQFKLHLDRYARDEPAAKKVIAHGESKADPTLKPAELAAYTLVANMILNLDETVTRN